MEKIRIQKLIAESLSYSRRKAEDLIKSNIVKCNGRLVKLGDKASYNDIIVVDGVRLNFNISSKKIYIMLNKPRGYITTTSDEKGRKTVLDLIYPKIKERVYPVGRLDKDSQGLLLLTNDGEFCNFVIHPKNKIEKTYIVTINQEIKDWQIKALQNGVVLDGEKTKPCKIEIILNSFEKSRFKVILQEGRKRQIRNMIKLVCKTEVKKLKRVEIGPIKLQNLPIGKFRELTKKELDLLKKQIGKF